MERASPQRCPQACRCRYFGQVPGDRWRRHPSEADAGFRAFDADGESAAPGHTAGAQDERPGARYPRVSGASDRPRLGRHQLGEVGGPPDAGGPAERRVLHEPGLSIPQVPSSARHARAAGGVRSYRRHAGEIDPDRAGGSEQGGVGSARDPRFRVGGRERRRARRGLDRWRGALAERAAFGAETALRLAPVYPELDAQGARLLYDYVARHGHGRTRAADRVAVESLGLLVEWHRPRRRDRGESIMRTGLLWLAFALAAGTADQATIARGQKEEQHTCLPCHSLRMVHSNRLSRAGGKKGHEKRAEWGRKYTARKALRKSGVPPSGAKKPAAPPKRGGAGRTKK